GGQGGQGGNGGPGGGGLGGPSMVIAFQGTAVEKDAGTTITPGSAGLGGPGGTAGLVMDAGNDGIAAPEQGFP
ncbi:MAG TPA: hypothetical protein VLS89_17015, partial [Candidatus Nanopelagicales bacterium]|nr:hypothetical protein [Candidatus Nanopelagicales bacterium]